MSRVFLAAVIYMILTCPSAWGQDAVDYYNIGLKSSLTNRKIQYFTKAIELDPSFVAAYRKRGMLYYFKDKYDKVIQDYTKVIELKPDLAESYQMLSVAYLRTGRLEEAIDNATRAIELDPTMSSAHGHRAEAYRLKGMPQEALRDSDMAIHLRGDDKTMASVYETKAKAYRQLGHRELADAAHRKSFEFDPRYMVYPIAYGITSFTTLAAIRGMGLLVIIGLLFVWIFKLALPAPRKLD